MRRPNLRQTGQRCSFDSTVSSTPAERLSIVPLNAGPVISSIIARKSRSAAATLVPAIAIGACRCVAAPGAGPGRARHKPAALVWSLPTTVDPQTKRRPARWPGPCHRRRRQGDREGLRKPTTLVAKQCFGVADRCGLPADRIRRSPRFLKLNRKATLRQSPQTWVTQRNSGQPLLSSFFRGSARPVETSNICSVAGGRSRFHQPPPRAWNSAAVSDRRLACA